MAAAELAADADADDADDDALALNSVMVARNGTQHCSTNDDDARRMMIPMISIMSRSHAVIYILIDMAL